jgi:hypothetical protein
MKNKTFKWRPFEEARAYVRSLGLKNTLAWQMWAKSGRRPKDIPSHPWSVYRQSGWINMGDWLGTGNIYSRERKFRSFEDARNFVRSRGFKSYAEWRAWTKSPEFPRDIPAFPRAIYKKKIAEDSCLRHGAGQPDAASAQGWKGFLDWLHR